MIADRPENLEERESWFNAAYALADEGQCRVLDRLFIQGWDLYRTGPFTVEDSTETGQLFMLRRKNRQICIVADGLKLHVVSAGEDF